VRTPRIAVCSDVEGDLAYWSRYIALSDALEREGAGSDGEGGGALVLRDGWTFVFGGDAVDKGVGDLAVCRDLVALKRRFPERVRLLLGNRDINKLRFGHELARYRDAPADHPGEPAAAAAERAATSKRQTCLHNDRRSTPPRTASSKHSQIPGPPRRDREPREAPLPHAPRPLAHSRTERVPPAPSPPEESPCLRPISPTNRDPLPGTRRRLGAARGAATEGTYWTKLTPRDYFAREGLAPTAANLARWMLAEVSRSCSRERSGDRTTSRHDHAT
jgi:hypothetical protein